MRDYDPTLGRYLQADPLGLVDGASVYGYALQNPGRYVDPTGLITLGDARRSLADRGVPYEGQHRGKGRYTGTQIFDEWLRQERANTGWQAGLPACPIRVVPGGNYAGPIWRGLQEMGNRENAYHPGDGLLSMRSQPNDYGAGCQCIYDFEGVIVLPGQHREVVDGRWQDRAGTRDRYSPDITDPLGVWGHRNHDVLPYDLAGELGRLNDYFSVRPLVFD